MNLTLLLAGEGKVATMEWMKSGLKFCSYTKEKFTELMLLQLKNLLKGERILYSA